jgi:DNA-binding XRE family transcriptional regulator
MTENKRGYPLLMTENKKCNFCDNKSAIQLGETLLCAKHYFAQLSSKKASNISHESPLIPKPHSQNHWSILLRDLRYLARLTQRDLAQRTKMSQRTISDYENINAPRQLSIYKVERLLLELGYDLNAVLMKKDV